MVFCRFSLHLCWGSTSSPRSCPQSQTLSLELTLSLQATLGNFTLPPSPSSFLERKNKTKKTKTYVVTAPLRSLLTLIMGMGPVNSAHLTCQVL